MAALEWCRGRTLGRGSSATVSLAVAARSGELFAVKSAGLSRAAPLRREQDILSGLNSPYVISYLGFDDAAAAAAAGEPQFNLFLEYAPGGSLSDEIKKRGGRLDEKAIRSRAYEILRGLAYLHGAGIAHCDVKGQNVLIGSEGRAKIADFGCARRVGGGAGGQFSGTPAFMAPEVARGEEQGTPADIWALGCTVLEMAAGRAPWPEFSDPVAALHHIGFSAQVPEIPLWLPEEGEDFVRKCLRRDPGERWTAEQLLRHPFLEPAAIRCRQDQGFWVSPKSTLDQGFWESESEEDDEPADDKFAAEEDPSRRIRMLSKEAEELSAPDWKWGDDWITVRSNSSDEGDKRGGPTIEQEEEEEEEEEEGPAPDFCCGGGGGVLSSSVGSGVGDGERDFIFSIDHMGSEDSHYNSHGYAIISESSRGEIGDLNGPDLSMDSPPPWS
ncbi:Mitogen-activated protein kinase kinase kinase A [Ananas comosus]|uniref:Mitogen-activated protein kinase kinase kinase A n=1 Tax=Ananas comosus TaxID=4615 RepID=A0A199W0G6_ANACO|nr:Mitogen-activated protein kinase kinase kinase A [Ananas comosus]